MVDYSRIQIFQIGRNTLRIVWIENDADLYFFTSTRKRIETDHSIAFDLTEDYGRYPDIEVAVFLRDEELLFKSDCFDDKSEEFVLRLFSTAEENILIFENDMHRIYFHLT